VGGRCPFAIVALSLDRQQPFSCTRSSSLSFAYPPLISSFAYYLSLLLSSGRSPILLPAPTRAQRPILMSSFSLPTLGERAEPVELWTEVPLSLSAAIGQAVCLCWRPSAASTVYST
jgi:hypothetical protein